MAGQREVRSAEFWSGHPEGASAVQQSGPDGLWATSFVCGLKNNGLWVHTSQMR